MKHVGGPIKKRRGANLPHWTRTGGAYSVTFRLADSIPRAAAEKLGAELAALELQLDQARIANDAYHLVRLARLKLAALDGALDKCHGACLFRDESLAQIVADALRFFQGKRYELFAWCVMPNHVHVVFAPLPGHELSGILHSWKSFTANEINKRLGRTGGVWQSESYDHLIRGREDMNHHVEYVRNNPIKAGLKDWKWVG